MVEGTLTICLKIWYKLLLNMLVQVILRVIMVCNKSALLVTTTRNRCPCTTVNQPLCLIMDGTSSMPMLFNTHQVMDENRKSYQQHRKFTMEWFRKIKINKLLIYLLPLWKTQNNSILQQISLQLLCLTIIIPTVLSPLSNPISQTFLTLLNVQMVFKQGPKIVRREVTLLWSGPKCNFCRVS